MEGDSEPIMQVKINPPTPNWNLVQTSVDGLYYFGFSFWMGECISMFGYRYMIPPRGGDRRGVSWLVGVRDSSHWTVYPYGVSGVPTSP